MAQNQQYWLPGYELSRHVVLSNIQFFLGPTASVRPYSYQGREGYLITGSPLTRTQIEDLARMSREYEREASKKMAQSAGIPSKGDETIPEPYINEPVYVGPRDRPRERVREREREYRPQHSDRHQRSKRSW